jgi:hypothetical protein
MAETLRAGTQADKVHAPGHNGVSKQALVDFYNRIENLSNDFASASGEFRSDVKAVLDEAAGSLNMTRKVLRHEFGRIRAARQLAKKEAEFEANEKESLEVIRAALGDFIDTPLGSHAVGE